MIILWTRECLIERTSILFSVMQLMEFYLLHLQRKTSGFLIYCYIDIVGNCIFMLLAIARQMIVEHTSPQENLLAVLSVGVLFVIRKFLYISRLDKRRELERKKKEDKQKGSVPSPAAENAEASAAEPLQSDEMRKRDEFHIDEELEELERLKAAVERKAEEELRRIEQMEKNVIH